MLNDVFPEHSQFYSWSKHRADNVPADQNLLRVLFSIPWPVCLLAPVFRFRLNWRRGFGSGTLRATWATPNAGARCSPRPAPSRRIQFWTNPAPKIRRARRRTPSQTPWRPAATPLCEERSCWDAVSTCQLSVEQSSEQTQHELGQRVNSWTFILLNQITPQTCEIKLPPVTLIIFEVAGFVCLFGQCNSKNAGLS